MQFEFYSLNLLHFAYIFVLFFFNFDHYNSFIIYIHLLHHHHHQHYYFNNNYYYMRIVFTGLILNLYLQSYNFVFGMHFQIVIHPPYKAFKLYY